MVFTIISEATKVGLMIAGIKFETFFSGLTNWTQCAGKYTISPKQAKLFCAPLNSKLSEDFNC